MPLLNIMCPICTRSFEDEDDVYSTSCGHLFHNSCLSNWHRKEATCPQCRRHNPKCYKLYLSFEEPEYHEEEDTGEELEEMRLKLTTSNEKITEILVQKNEAETNFMQLQKQFNAQENLRKQHEEGLIEFNDFLCLHKQYTEYTELVAKLRDRVNKLFLENENKTKELKLKTLEMEKLRTSLEQGQCYPPGNESMERLEHKLKLVSEKLDEEISKNSKLTAENMKLEYRIKSLNIKEEIDVTEQSDYEYPSSSENAQNIAKDNTLKTILDKYTPYSLFIQDLPLDQVTTPLETVINLASKINLKVSADDLIIVNFVNKEDCQVSKNELFVQFKSTYLKNQFISRKGILKNDPKTKSIHIGNYMNDEVRSLFIYAKEKLRNCGYEHFYFKDNIVFAKKNRNRRKTFTIRSHNDVDKLCNELV